MELTIRIDLTSPRWLRRSLLLGIPVAAMALTSAALGLTKFAGGTVIKSSELNANFTELDGRITAAEDTLMNGVDHAKTADDAAPGTFNVPGTLQVVGNATVGGVISVGLNKSIACTFVSAAGYSDCTCGPNELAIGGGAYSTGGYLEESQNAAVGAIGPTWRLACKNSAGTRIQCTSPSAICARLGS